VNPSDFKSTERLFEVGPSKQLLREQGKELATCPHIYVERKVFPSSILGVNSGEGMLGKKRTIGGVAAPTNNRSLEQAPHKQVIGSSFNVSLDRGQKLSTKGSSSFD
jgi:hypothetical protein